MYNFWMFFNTFNFFYFWKKVKSNLVYFGFFWPMRFLCRFGRFKDYFARHLGGACRSVRLRRFITRWLGRVSNRLRWRATIAGRCSSLLRRGTTDPGVRITFLWGRKWTFAGNVISRVFKQFLTSGFISGNSAKCLKAIDVSLSSAYPTFAYVGSTSNSCTFSTNGEFFVGTIETPQEYFSRRQPRRQRGTAASSSWKRGHAFMWSTVRCGTQ